MHRLLVTVSALVAALVLAGGAGAWTWPADGVVLRPFQLGADAYAGGQHRGIDVAGEEGSPVRAPAGGTVTFAGTVPTHGRGVTIATGDGYSVTLVHLGSIAVAKGDAVAEGATVGGMGTSGEAEHARPSVHLGIRRTSEAEAYLDPLGLLPARPTAPTPGPPPAATPAPAPAPSPAPPVAVAPTPVAVTPTPTVVAPTPPPASAPAPSPVQPPAAPVAPEVAAPAVPVSVAPAPDSGLVVSKAPAVAEKPVVVEHAARPERRVADRVHPSTRQVALTDPIADPVVASSATATRDVPPRSTVDAVTTATDGAATRGRVDADLARPSPAPSPQHEPRATARVVTRELDAAHGSTGSREQPQPAPQLAVATGDRAVDVPRSGDARDARSGSPTIAAEPRQDGGLDVTNLVLPCGLALVAAAMAGWKAARRIGGHGALLPDDADLLRERDPAHRACVHDRGRGRLRPAPAAARS